MLLVLGSEKLPDTHKTGEREHEEADDINGTKYQSKKTKDPVIHPSCSNQPKNNNFAKEEYIGLIRQHIGKHIRRTEAAYFTPVLIRAVYCLITLYKIKTDKAGKVYPSKKENPICLGMTS